MNRASLARQLPEAGTQILALLDPKRGPIEFPVRSEIFGVRRFVQHGKSLGDAHHVRVGRRASPFFPRLGQNIAVLREAHAFIALQVSTGHHVYPAGEWLLDNFYVVLGQLKEIHEALPLRYFRDLPVLADAHLAGLPRVYGVAWAFVAHTDSAFDEGLLTQYLRAYQQATEFTLGELWALPTTLRVVLVENLRRLAERVATAKAATINVVLAAPDGVGDGPPKLDARPAFAGDQQATPPLPRAEQPVQGRFATDEGYRFDNPQPFGDPLTFLVVRSSGDWLQVQLPVRPNGTMGWIKKSEVEMSEVGSHVEVNVAERKLRVFDGTSLIEEAPVAVGVDATRTPTGRHFMTDKLAEPGGAQRHPWSLGISAYSEQLDTFDGGAPQIAMHGWRDSSVFGQARSNGCIRVPSGVIDRLAALPLGTPIDVYAN